MELEKEISLKLKRNLIWKVLFGVLGLFVLLVVFNSFAKVDYGHVGLRETFGKLSSEVLTPGIHFKIPFVQNIVSVNVQTAKAEADAAASSKDLQPVHTHVVVNYRVDENNVYNLMNNIGLSYETKIIHPAIQEVLKEVTARYSAEDLIVKRNIVATEIQDGLTKRLQRYNLVTQDISITNFEFSKAFADSIEAKQVAQQNAIKAQNDLQRIKVEAEQTITQAKAQAEAMRLQKEQVTPELIELKKLEVQEKAIEMWDGHLPQVSGGNTPFINLPMK